jgi:hypothetical protein
MMVIFLFILCWPQCTPIWLSVVDGWMLALPLQHKQMQQSPSHLLYVVEQFLQEFLEKVSILPALQNSRLHRPQVRTNLDVWNWNKSLY